MTRATKQDHNADKYLLAQENSKEERADYRAVFIAAAADDADYRAVLALERNERDGAEDEPDEIHTAFSLGDIVTAHLAQVL